MVESVYNQGGDPTKLLTVPALVRKFSEYLFTSSARVATLMSDQGKSREKAAALGSVNVFVTDFGTLDLVPNRLQQLQDTAENRQMSVDWTLIVNTEKAHAMIGDVDQTAAVLAVPA